MRRRTDQILEATAARAKPEYENRRAMFEDGGLQTRRGSDGIRDPSSPRKRAMTRSDVYDDTVELSSRGATRVKCELLVEANKRLYKGKNGVPRS
jgi:hypothetical protein